MCRVDPAPSYPFSSVSSTGSTCSMRLVLRPYKYKTYLLLVLLIVSHLVLVDLYHSASLHTITAWAALESSERGEHASL